MPHDSTKLHFGFYEFHGHLQPSVLSTHLPLHAYTSPKWASNFADTITKHVALLQPKPEWLLMNEGLWKHKFFDKSYREAVVNALNSTGIRGIWRTMTYDKTGSMKEYLHRVGAYIPGGENLDHLMCNYSSIECMDISWQRDAPETLYWDAWHSAEPLYIRYNEQFLDILSRLKAI
jgi:hypothetical protein